MNRRFALAFPWFLLALVVGIIVFDQSRVRDVIELPANAAVSPAGDVPVGSVRDLVCGMNVRPRTAYPLRIGSRTFYFCSTRCRDRFLEDPARWMRAPQARRGGHTMQGLPTWMYQASVAIVLLLSFGIFEFVSWRAGKRAPVVPAIAARKPLTAHPGVRRLLRRPGFQTSARLMMVAIFLFIIYAGLFGNQNPTMNIAPLLTWTIWWAGLIFLILYFGKAWCYVCPWDALATWLERLSLKSPRRSGLGLRLPWPRRMRNIWFAVILFVLLTWVELGMGITSIPRATAWVALIILGLAIVSALVFDRKSFCRYGCLVGRVSGLYALFSSLELRAEDEAVCRSCKTHDCFKGNDRGDGCPTFEFPRVMKESTYCILCTECLKTCPHDNIAIRARPWGADLAAMGKPRTDEAFLAIILLSMTGFHGLTMTPAWHAWNEALQRTLGIAPGLSFGLLMLGMLLLPIAFFALIARISARWSAPHGTRALFLHYAYALLPIALFYHLAHNAGHFFMEGPKIVALLSDPLGRGWNLFGTAGWNVPPLISLEGLWWIQVLFVLIGHVYSLWITERTTRKLVPNRRDAFFCQLPMLIAMVLFSTFSLWLLRQPMEMRVSAM